MNILISFLIFFRTELTFEALKIENVFLFKWKNDIFGRLNF